MIAPGEAWGPFARDLDDAERRARLRSLRQTARLLTGPRAADLCRLLARAEIDPASLEPASHALNAMAATDKRAIWASYAALARSAASPQRLPPCASPKSTAFGSTLTLGANTACAGRPPPN